ncbi:DUF3696 domain-containing protein [Mesorhizobium sp. M0843]|uniref:AAA family ATPase n=1 Tax=Mesorhizobium sp. M0843 TaxID=2957010 RepID=UPI00333CBDFB
MTIRVAVRGFKCFDHLSIDISRLTIFTGFNGAGKSTVIQTLLLLSQSLRLAPTGSSIDLNGPLVQLGNALDVMHFGGSPAISFSLAEGDTIAQWTLLAEKRARHLRVEEATFGTLKEAFKSEGRRISPEIGNAAFPLCEMVRDLTFLGASRLFSTAAWPSPPINNPFADVGKAGEFAPYWHFQLGDEEVQLARRHPSDERSTVRGQIDAYMSDLFPGAQANTDLLSNVDLFRLDLRLRNSDWVRPGNIGFGLTYVFPLLVALVTAKENQIVIVDSPEAHLHPRAQSELGKIVARFAAAGVRVLVETHSDHFLNGVRIATRSGTVSPQDTSIYFFSGTSETGHGVQALHLDAKGEIDSWPKGFFDQAENDFSRLLGIDAP